MKRALFPLSTCAALCSVLLVPSDLTAQGGARAMGPGSLDLSFDPTQGGERLGLAGASPRVHAVVEQPDGRVLVGGWFSGVNGVPRNNIARFNADGSLDLTFQPGLGPDGGVGGIALQTDGRVIIIGDFRAVNGQPHPLIARLNADGSLDETFNCRLAGELNLWLTGVAVQSNGKIWIGGRFTSVNGVARLNLARLNTDGSLDAEFDPEQAIPGSNDWVDALRLQANDKLLVAGAWSAPRRSLVRLNQDGTLDAGFAGVTVSHPLSGDIRDIACNRDGVVAIVGHFLEVNGVRRRYVARLDSEGGLDTAFDPGEGPDYNFLWAVAVQADGKVIVGGNFHAMDGVAREGIARFNIDGTVDSGFDPANAAGVPAGYHPSIASLALQTDGRLLVAASAWWAQENNNSVFRLDNAGQLEPGFAPLLHAPAEWVDPIALQPDGKILISTFGSYTRNALMRLNPSGTMDPSFVPDTDLGFVRALVLQPDGKVVVARSQSEFQDCTLVRLFEDGRVDESFRAPVVRGGEAPIEVLALQPDGKILVGGLIWEVEGRPHQGIIRLHADGSFDSDFQPVPISVTDDPGYGVEHILVLRDGKIFIAGGFSWDSGEEAGIALLEPDGRVNADFAANVTIRAAYVYAAARQADGKFLLSGYFSGVGVGVIRLNADGAEDRTFQRFLGTECFALAVQADGRIVLALGSPQGERVIRLNPDGSPDPAFEAELYPWGARRLLIQPDGQVLIAGGFHSVDGIPMHGIARLNNDVHWRLEVRAPEHPGPFHLMVTGRPGVRLIIEGSTNLLDWTALGEVITGPEPVSFVDRDSARSSEGFYYRAREAE